MKNVLSILALLEIHAKTNSGFMLQAHICMYICMYVHCVSKKQDTKLLPITSPNVNRFSKFFHWQTHR